ncbi:MAG: mechanosensitive ion channel family protein [Alphaproteobacteria bacterium]|nr:mechanosensitive ion channel family protein [Alphaproteobacteria bacterium]
MRCVAGQNLAGKEQIGLDLAKDPEFAPLILEPLKMQGVERLGDFAVQIRMKMMTLPGEQFVIRRKAYAMVKKAFDAMALNSRSRPCKSPAKASLPVPPQPGTSSN